MKKITYILGAVLSAGAAFAVTPAGQALIHQYPILSGVVSIIGILGALFHTPKADA